MAHDVAMAGGSGAFDLTQFLAGETRAWGIFEDRFGRVRRRFHVALNGQWDGRAFRLDERFMHGDGMMEWRSWLITPAAGGTFSATSDDCVGAATGVCSGDTVRMTYRFRLRLAKRTLLVDVDDRVYRISDRQAINRARMSKWGVTIGTVTLCYERAHPAAVATGSLAA